MIRNTIRSAYSSYSKGMVYQWNSPNKRFGENGRYFATMAEERTVRHFCTTAARLETQKEERQKKLLLAGIGLAANLTLGSALMPQMEVSCIPTIAEELKLAGIVIAPSLPAGYMYGKESAQAKGLKGQAYQDEVLLSTFEVALWTFVGEFPGASVSAQTVCFVAGTQVQTAEGARSIEEILPGDEVYAKDPDSGKTEKKKVLQTFVREVTELVHVSIGEETIDTTENHLFYVEEYGFKAAGELKPGDIVQTRNGGTVEVTDVREEHLDHPVKVFNFEVEDFHTYYVGETGVLVHNDCVGQSGEGRSGADDIIQYERLKSQYAAEEIYNADRVGSALKEDPTHRAASYLSQEQLAKGRIYSYRGGDNRIYKLLQTEGQLNDVDGIYEYIINDTGQVTHQRFIQGGKYTGFPNQKVPKGGD